MPDADHSSSNSPLLPVDMRVDALLSDLNAIEDPERRHRSFAERAARADLHMAAGIGRRLLRTRARLRELQEAVDQYETEVNEIAEPLAREERDLIEMLHGMAVVRRDAGLGNFLDIPGVGRISTRAPSPRWYIDNNEVIAGLAGDDRSLFVEKVPPAPPAERVKGTDLRKHLDDLLAAATETIDKDQAAVEQAGGAPLPEGVRERLILDAAERIAAQYPGVAYVPGELGITHKLNDEVQP